MNLRLLLIFLILIPVLAVPDDSPCTTGFDCDNWICVDTDGGLYPGNGVDTCNSSSLVTPGTLCDYNNSVAVEVIGSLGSCDLRQENCTVDYFYFSSVSSTSQMDLYSNITCQCGDMAACNITITDSNDQETWYATNSTGLLTGFSIYSPPVLTGTNLVRVNCTCSSTQSTCEAYTQNNATISSEIINVDPQLPIGPNHDFNTSITVRNLGYLGLDLNLTDLVFNSSSCTADENIPYWWLNYTFHLNATGVSGDIQTIVLNRSTNCNNTGEEYIHTITLNDTNLNIGVMNQTNYTGGCFAVRECYDYADPLIDPRQQCNLCGDPNKTVTDYSCVSNSYCCLTGEKFQNNACCPEGNTCCLSNSDCQSDQYCDTSINSCVNKGTSGSSCINDADCISGHCDNGYCCESTTLLPEACEDSGGQCKCCRFSSDCSATYYCDSYADQCIQCSSNDDGICDGAPSTNCVTIDPNCCGDDGDCLLGQYCDTNSLVCRSCSTKSEQWCPSTKCIGTDPDCCDELNPCSSGDCDPFTNTCEIVLGNACNVNEDCASGSCKHNKCTLKEFIILQPSAIKINIRNRVFTTVTVLNYWNQPVQVLLTIDSPIARFINRQSTIIVNLNEGENRVIPLILESSLPGNFLAIVTAQDSTYSDVSTTKNMQIVVSGEDARQQVVTAPESINLMLLFVLYGFGIWKILGKES
jgi:hypothetical protein